jgi:hypothetical protein
LANEFEEGETCFGHHLFAAAAELAENKRDDFALHGWVVFENINCVDKYVTLLQRVFLAQQHLYALRLAQILFDAQSLDFLWGLNAQWPRFNQEKQILPQPAQTNCDQGGVLTI